MDPWPEALRRAGESLRELGLDPGAFAAQADACRARGARPEHAGDLALAWAVTQGSDAAARRFEELVRPDVEAAARRVDGAPAFVDEVLQTVRVRLLVPPAGEPGGRTRLNDYAGRGPLRGWVGVAATRAALNLKRGAHPVAAPEVLADLVSLEPDPELRHLKTQYRQEFRQALEAALAALSARQRAVLRLSFVDGLRLAQLARLYGVHESTASRWLSQAAAAVADDARRRLTARLALSPSAADSVARMVLSNLDLSIARLL